MITVQVKNSIKCNCEKSIFISFPYDISIINIIRSFPIRFWHPDIKCWELPYTSLERLQYVLNTEKFDVTNDFENSNFILPKDFSFKTTPFKHQIEGIKYGLDFNTWILADEQGVGKSKTVIDLAVIKKIQEGYKHCLIVCGVNSLKWNWVKEINTHSNEKAWVLGQRKKNGKWDVESNQAKLDDLININTNDSYFLITNIETLRNGPIVDELIKLCKNDTISMIALDEAHTCFDYDTLIQTDSGELKIGNIVTKKQNVKVASYNFKTNEVEYKPIKNYFSLVSKEILELTIEYCDKTYKIKCTPEHKIYTSNRGWVRAIDLTEDDDIKVF